jgi:O-methyltransferase
VVQVVSDGDPAAELYLDLLKQVLTRRILPERYRPLSGLWGPTKGIYKPLLAVLQRTLARKNLELVRRHEADWAQLEHGHGWPPDAETMVGMKRLENVQACIADVLRDGVPGDLIEAGTWRGGTAIFMRAALSALGDTTRTVWVADSFEGLPKPDSEKYPRDAGDDHWQSNDYLAVSLENVQANFKRYGFLDDRVRFLKGWFKDTLSAPITTLAVARLDGDMYESTIQALDPLYPKLSIGGYLIIDDYALPGCRAAVDDYRGSHAITEEIRPVDWTGVYWRRLK